MGVVLLVELLQITRLEGVPQGGYVDSTNCVAPVHKEVSIAGVVVERSPDTAVCAGGTTALRRVHSECGRAALCDPARGLVANLFVDLVHVGIGHKDFTCWLHTHLSNKRKIRCGTFPVPILFAERHTTLILSTTPIQLERIQLKH